MPNDPRGRPAGKCWSCDQYVWTAEALDTPCMAPRNGTVCGGRILELTVGERLRLEMPAPTAAPTSCLHTEVMFTGQLNKMGDTGHHSLDLAVACQTCGTPFEFVGLPGGYSPVKPACSVDRQEARLPLVLAGLGKPKRPGQA